MATLYQRRYRSDEALSEIQQHISKSLDMLDRVQRNHRSFDSRVDLRSESINRRPANLYDRIGEISDSIRKDRQELYEMRRLSLSGEITDYMRIANELEERTTLPIEE